VVRAVVALLLPPWQDLLGGVAGDDLVALGLEVLARGPEVGLALLVEAFRVGADVCTLDVAKRSGWLPVRLGQVVQGPAFGTRSGSLASKGASTIRSM